MYENEATSVRFIFSAFFLGKEQKVIQKMSFLKRKIEFGPGLGRRN